MDEELFIIGRICYLRQLTKPCNELPGGGGGGGRRQGDVTHSRVRRRVPILVTLLQKATE